MEYKKGRENRVADALSRASHSSEIRAISTVVPVWMEQVANSYEHDTKCLDLIAKLGIDSTTIPNYSLHSGILIYKGKLYIGDNQDLRKQLLDSFHSSALGGHSGERATYKRLKLLFYWPNMQQQVKEYVRVCPVYQKNKSENTPYPGLLAPLPFLKWLGLTSQWIS